MDTVKRTREKSHHVKINGQEMDVRTVIRLLIVPQVAEK